MPIVLKPETGQIHVLVICFKWRVIQAETAYLWFLYAVHLWMYNLITSVREAGNPWPRPTLKCKLYCGVPGSPCLSKTALVLARIFSFLIGLSVCIHLDKVLRSPVDGLKGPWPVCRRSPEPRQFFGDPALLACDINIGLVSFFYCSHMVRFLIGSFLLGLISV